jgi:uncharacterized membrane protein
MSKGRFGMGEAIRFGWDTMKSNIGFFIGLLIVAFLIENLPGIISHFVTGTFPMVAVLLTAAGMLLGMVVQMGLMKVSIKFCDGIKGQLDDLLSSFNLLLKYFAGSLVYFLIVIGGIILLIVPGIIWAIKFSLFPYFIVDKGLGPIEAIKASGRATDDAKWDLFLFGGLLGLINLAGALVFLVGLFATIPASMVAYAYAYRKLSGENTVSRMPEKSPQKPSASGTKGGVMYINLGT